MSPGKVVHSFCRICNNHCAIKVQVEDGAAIRVTGDADNPLFGGYTCIKGRAQAQFLRGEERLRHSLKRGPDGRFRPIPEINSPQVQLRNFAERTALNSPLQGTAADLIKLAMIRIDARLRKEKFAARMILQVHDELLFETPPDEQEELQSLVRKEMEEVHRLAVPVVVEICAGANWRDME